MLKQIYISTSFRWIHSYENLSKKIKDNPLHELVKVGYLTSKHRHKFNVKVWFKIDHNDRDLEFFLMQEKVDIALQTLYSNRFWLLEVWSCEMIAQDLLEFFDDVEITKIEVNEDWENGVEFIS